MVLRLDIDDAVKRRIEDIARTQGVSTEDVVRAAIEQFISAQEWPETWLERAEALGLIGCSESSPPDLSTNKAYMEGFGVD
jgi:predicted transcriptional regulator